MRIISEHYGTCQITDDIVEFFGIKGRINDDGNWGLALFGDDFVTSQPVDIQSMIRDIVAVHTEDELRRYPNTPSYDLPNRVLLGPVHAVLLALADTDFRQRALKVLTEIFNDKKDFGIVDIREFIYFGRQFTIAVVPDRWGINTDDFNDF